MTETVPPIVLLSWANYQQQRKTDGAAAYAMGYHVRGVVVAWRFAALLPWYGPRLLAHEGVFHHRHDKRNSDHAPWWTFRIECGHALRLRDPAGLLEEARPWLRAHGVVR